MEKKQHTPKPGDRLLNTATRLFCLHGINATGIDKILAEAGVAKMTLYNQFGSKEGLVFAVLEREGEAWRGDVPVDVANRRWALLPLSR
jgi:AcrR family transcriptional regulator